MNSARYVSSVVVNKLSRIRMFHVHQLLNPFDGRREGAVCLYLLHNSIGINQTFHLSVFCQNGNRYNALFTQTKKKDSQGIYTPQISNPLLPGPTKFWQTRISQGTSRPLQCICCSGGTCLRPQVPPMPHRLVHQSVFVSFFGAISKGKRKQ